MSVQQVQSNIERCQRDVSSLQRKFTEESQKEATKTGDISRIRQSISRTTSETSLRTKLRDIESRERDIVSIQKRKADLSKQMADKTATLHKYQNELFKEQGKEQKKMLDTFKRRDLETKRSQDDLLRQVKLEANRASIPVFERFEEKSIVRHDAFISHASEDKESLARPLAEKLQDAGFSIWYDEFQLRVGDSLRRSIDRGLASSRFGIVVLSPNFFSKNWPQYELDGLVAKEMLGNKVILPLWHKVSKDEVLSYSPTLADKVALNTSTYSIDELAKELGEILKEQ